MTLREFFLERFKAEMPVFVRVLKAVPGDRADYKPEDRSASAKDLVWKLTNEIAVSLKAAVEYQGEWTMAPAPPLDEMIALYERSANDLIARIAKMDEEAWMRPAKFLYGGHVISEQPIGPFLWFILFDAIHHRGQLSTYLRPMGSKVPAIYGPSADEKPAG